jgi:hypothetical protein
MNDTLTHNGYTITIWKCQDRNWCGWYEYAVTVENGTQKIVGRSRGTKREIINDFKRHTESDFYKALKQAVQS